MATNQRRTGYIASTQRTLPRPSFARLDFLARRKTHRARDGNAKPAPRSGNWLVRHPFLAVSLLVLLVSSPVLQNKFVDWDDEIYLSGYAPVHLGLTWQGIEYAFTSVKEMYWQ